MATATPPIRIFSNSSSNNNNNNNEVSKKEIQAAIAKAMELRALHSALLQGNSPVHLKFPSSSPVSLSSASHLSAHDYPVFTPSYDDKPCHQVPVKTRALSESYDGNSQGNGERAVSSDHKNELRNFEPHLCPAEYQKSFIESSSNNITLLQKTSVSSCNRCKPAIITKESDNSSKTTKHSNIVVPLTDSHSSPLSQPKNRSLISRLLPKLKKKNKYENSLSRTDQSEEVSQILKDNLGIISVESLKKEMIEANERRDAALAEVSDMRSSIGEMKKKLEYLETYCEDLKRALKQATTDEKALQVAGKLGNIPKRGKPSDGNVENTMPVDEEVMIEGFLQIVSEARVSVKQFCKILISQIEENDMNILLQPYKLSPNSKYSKIVLYHMEAIINQSLYQDFENCVFQKNGSPKLLDPQEDRKAQFSSFVALRNLSWSEVLRKGTKHYSEELSKFCDQKMSCIITRLNWTRAWCEELLQAFFVAAKCIWLLHLLAFSFDPPLGIMRVEENMSFDPYYMDDVVTEKQRSNGLSTVKIMVMPGFYVKNRVVRCKVLCRRRFEAKEEVSNVTVRVHDIDHLLDSDSTKIS